MFLGYKLNRRKIVVVKIDIVFPLKFKSKFFFFLCFSFFEQRLNSNIIRAFEDDFRL